MLVTGGAGLLGSEVVAQALARGDEVLATTSRVPGLKVAGGVRWQHLDIRDRDGCLRVLREAAPDVVVHTAYNYRDWTTTADGAAHVALAATAVGAHLVHVSSDALFSGRRPSYDESCAPDPITAYGAAKAAAETAVRAVAPTATIARSSLVLGPGSPMEKLVHDLIGGADGVLFADDVRCPVHRCDSAAALLELADARATGLFHCGGADAVSRVELGELIAARDGLDLTGVRTGSRRDLPEPGPMQVRLDSRRTQAGLRTRLRGAREFLAP
nr:sugar nucleotide-binding protein [Flexivirga meconopsidis]